MGVVWRKVWRDLAHNKARTVLAVLSTAVGVFALGLVFGLSGVMRARMTEVHQATVPAHITFYGGPFSREVVDAIRGEPGVLDTEGEIGASFRWRPEGEDDWRSGNLVAREDYDGQRMEHLWLLDGDWPTGRRLGVERLAARHFSLSPGSTVVVELGRREHRLTVAGVVRAHMVLPPQWGGSAMFFATPETVAWLAGQGLDYTHLHVRLESFSQTGAEEAAERIQERLERMGLTVRRYSITDPNVHWQQEMMDAVFMVMAVLGVLSLALSGFLIVNTMSAIVAQQVWQIGVMKAVGATLSRLVRVYLATALVYGALALLLAVPLGTLSAYWIGVWMLDLFNITLDSFQVSPGTILIQVAVGMCVPVVAAFVPVIGGARVTAHQAIGTHGIGIGFGQGWLDRVIGRIRRLPRPVVLSLRNTFRHKARVALTLLTLTLGGVMFGMIMSVDHSFMVTIDNLFEQIGYDLSISLDRPYHASRLIEVAEGVPGVVAAEVWNHSWATMPLASGEEHPVNLEGVPPQTALFDPRVVGGRNLRPEDGNAVLINNRLAEEEGIEVGDEIVLTIGERESAWTVVGIALNVSGDQDDFFVPFGALARETGTVNRGQTVRMISERQDTESHRQLVDMLGDAYAEHRMEVTGYWSASEGREQNRALFNTLTYTLLSMAVLAAAVGGIGLASTMSINVVERRREIGVMRAVGASSPAVAGIFVVEGMFVGLLSWLLAVPVSIPGARVFSDVIGETVINFPLDFAYSVGGMLLWLGIVVVLSALASLWPSLQATRVSVREALAYE